MGAFNLLILGKVCTICSLFTVSGRERELLIEFFNV
jgi:hypothetical protein